MEQESPSAAAAKKIFSITYHIVAKGLSLETNSPLSCLDLNRGIITYGASLSMVNCLGMA